MGGWGWGYKRVHLKAFAAVTQCDLPWALGTVRARMGGWGVGSQKIKENKRKEEGPCVSSYCLVVIRRSSISVVAVYPSAAQG